MKKGIVIMAILGLTSMFAACNCNNGEKQVPSFAKDAEMRAIAENFIDNDIAQKTPLVEKREAHLISIVSLVVQQSGMMLADETSAALADGLSAEEILEAAYQCAPYSGLPRVADAVEVIHGVFKAKGVKVDEARATVNADTRLAEGAEAQTTLFSRESFRENAKLGKDKMPPVQYFLSANCFGDYYTRKGIDLKTRELLTMSILVNLGTEPQLLAHTMANLGGGRTPEYLEQAIYRCLPFCGYPRTLNALRILKDAQTNLEKAKMSENQAKGLESIATAEKIFPRGEKNPYGKYFKGQSYLKMLNLDTAPVGNVTFEPGCRNKWHIHHGGGQLLIATAGEGWVQFEGKPAQKMKAGDAVYIPKEVKHWHGATKDSWFTHLSVEVPDPTTTNKTNEWLEDVSDEEYGKL